MQSPLNKSARKSEKRPTVYRLPQRGRKLFYYEGKWEASPDGPVTTSRLNRGSVRAHVIRGEGTRHVYHGEAGSHKKKPEEVEHQNRTFNCRKTPTQSPGKVRGNKSGGDAQGYLNVGTQGGEFTKTEGHDLPVTSQEQPVGD